MNLRSKLLVLIASFAVVGVGFISIPFISSMSPTDRANANLPHIDVSKIEPGQFVLVDHPIPFKYWNGFKQSVLVYRRSVDSFIAWEVPAKGTEIGMPDLRWWRPYYACKQFGPFFVNGIVDDSKPIKCHDKEVPSDWWSEQWQWTTDGRNLIGVVDDMPEAKGKIEGKYFVIGRRS